MAPRPSWRALITWVCSRAMHWLFPDQSVMRLPGDHSVAGPKTNHRHGCHHRINCQQCQKDSYK